MKQKISKKAGINNHKTPRVHNRYCRDCPFAQIYSTGSQLWTSCKFQDGWRSINAVCNLSETPQNKEENMKKMTLYSSKNCPRCKALKRWLIQYKVTFIEKSLDDTDVMTELVMRNLTVLSAPALEINNRVFLLDQIFDEHNQLKQELKHFLKGEKPQ
jgi:glutaredoxin